MNIIAIILIGTGLVFFLGGTVGILRFPDFYTRLHAAGKLDTMGLLMTTTGIAIYSIQNFSVGTLLIGLKIILIAVFTFMTSPTATHAIIDAGFRAGLKPWAKRSTEEST